MKPGDAAGAFAVRATSFSGADPGDHDPADERQYVAANRRLVAVDGKRIIGHLAAWPLKQYLLGKPVKVAGIASVAVLPHARGQGIASQLAERAVHEANDDGQAFAVLFPNTQGVYRRAGWEVAGTWTVNEVRAADLARLPHPDSDVTLRPPQAGDGKAMGALEAAAAVDDHGRVTRGVARRRMWLSDPAVRSVVAVRDGKPSGFMLWTMGDDPNAAGDRTSLRLRVHELVAADSQSWLALWHVLASHRSVAGAVRYVAPPIDPLTTFLRDQAIERAGSPWHWMTRVLDLDAALGGRGWPQHVNVAVPLTIHDSILGDRSGVLHVASGSAHFTAGDDAGVHVDVGAFSSLITGGFTATQLAWLGRLQGASRDHLRDLDDACRAPTPWTADHF